MKAPYTIRKSWYCPCHAWDNDWNSFNIQHIHGSTILSLIKVKIASESRSVSNWKNSRSLRSISQSPFRSNGAVRVVKNSQCSFDSLDLGLCPRWLAGLLTMRPSSNWHLGLWGVILASWLQCHIFLKVNNYTLLCRVQVNTWHCVWQHAIKQIRGKQAVIHAYVLGNKECLTWVLLCAVPVDSLDTAFRLAEHKIRKSAWLVVCQNNAHFDQSLVQFVQTLVHF